MPFDFEKFGDIDAFCIGAPDIEDVLEVVSVEDYCKGMNDDGSLRSLEFNLISPARSITVECQERFDNGGKTRNGFVKRLDIDIPQVCVDVMLDSTDLAEGSGVFDQSADGLLNEYHSGSTIGKRVANLYDQVYDLILNSERADVLFERYHEGVW